MTWRWGRRCNIRLEYGRYCVMWRKGEYNKVNEMEDSIKDDGKKEDLMKEKNKESNAKDEERKNDMIKDK